MEKDTKQKSQQVYLKTDARSFYGTKDTVIEIFMVKNNNDFA